MDHSYYLHPKKKKKRKIPPLILAGYLAALVVILLLSFWLWRKIGGNSAHQRPAAPISHQEAPKRLVTVKLFFASKEHPQLQPETRNITQTSSTAELAKKVLGELLKGPKREDLFPTIPPQTQLRELYIDNKDCAYVDLSPEVKMNHPGGITAELTTIYSIVNTLMANFKKIKKVQLLIAGKEVETLAGHIDIGQPLTSSVEMVAPSPSSQTESRLLPETAP